MGIASKKECFEKMQIQSQLLVIWANAVAGDKQGKVHFFLKADNHKHARMVLQSSVYVCVCVYRFGIRWVA